LRVRIARALTGQGADAIDALIRTSLADALDKEAHDAPETIGPWRLVRVLGAGGMAQVFEARRTEPDFEQRAALKILWPFRAGEEFHERFVQERRILAGISHPGIAGLLDGGMLPDRRPWFAMEYVEGLRIDDYCRDLALAERLSVFVQVCDAVEYAHGRLIVHRDIKPANILVDGTGRVRLLDFGIAKLLDTADDGAMTRTGGSLLTLQYASPEQVTDGPLSVASDVYQLGMLLYQLLAGQLPYDLQGRSLKQAIDMICSLEPPAPSHHRSEVARDLDAIVLFALRKEPAQRYGSVSA
jgi:serine/threonine protein kinase